ncbi:NADPH2:quinone reductase [Filomicrobium insigne]|uniref:NADPH2:quinone reductase n=1 Tax=Filomicrobium insigne TaxID=418854 RepID=A0A1H0QLC4_9HYPH|nr:quinone oxidoreductase [Filomicrobium insigne]SDP18191.1 NADPH2:quinone reductase [Filomicrobium insigne]
MVHAIRIHAYGGPEELKWEAVEIGEPGDGQIRIRHTAVGLNYIDTYHRTGLYPVGDLPATIGMEGAGEVIAIGPNVPGLKVGDRVAYANPMGSYAEERLIPADRVVKVPDSIDDQTAAAMMLQGMTARYLLRMTFPVDANTTLLFHAAAGGVGLIACQWAKYLGATIIGTVGSQDKAELAKAHGCTHVINYRIENFVDRVKEITEGRGCDVVYDGVGKDTFPASLDCLRPRGMWVSFGNASGPVTGFDIGLLGQKGSLFATRPSLFAYTSTREDLEACANDLFDVVTAGHVKINVNQTYPLSAAADAHRDLEARKTTGSTVLVP